MAILRRYRSQPTIENDGNTYSYRYSRLPQNSNYLEIVLDKSMTLDYISFMQYGTPLLYWAIADINNYLDPIITIPEGTRVKIPQL